VAIAESLNVCVDTVRAWRRRFAVDRLEGLRDRRRSGWPRVHDAAERAAVVALACALPAEQDMPLSRWSCPEMARELAARCHLRVSASSVRRWLAADALKPWHHRSWISIRDPDFEAKAARALDPVRRPVEGPTAGPERAKWCPRTTSPTPNNPRPTRRVRGPLQPDPAPRSVRRRRPGFQSGSPCSPLHGSGQRLGRGAPASARRRSSQVGSCLACRSPCTPDGRRSPLEFAVVWPRSQLGGHGSAGGADRGRVRPTQRLRQRPVAHRSGPQSLRSAGAPRDPSSACCRRSPRTDDRAPGGSDVHRVVATDAWSREPFRHNASTNRATAGRWFRRDATGAQQPCHGHPFGGGTVALAGARRSTFLDKSEPDLTGIRPRAKVGELPR
jgi:transposase